MIKIEEMKNFDNHLDVKMFLKLSNSEQNNIIEVRDAQMHEKIRLYLEKRNIAFTEDERHGYGKTFCFKIKNKKIFTYSIRKDKNGNEILKMNYEKENEKQIGYYPCKIKLQIYYNEA